MLDILLTEDGDIRINQDGDISLTDSVRQAIKIRLKWFLGEWRLGPEAGLPYFEEILIKNPNIPRCCEIFRDAILSVKEVTNVTDLSLDVDPVKRRTLLKFTAVTMEETFNEEVLLSV